MKRWLALVLAIGLLGVNTVYQLGTSLSAHEPQQTESVSEESKEAATKAALEQALGSAGTTEHRSAKDLVEALDGEDSEPDENAQGATVIELK